MREHTPSARLFAGWNNVEKYTMVQPINNGSEFPQIVLLGSVHSPTDSNFSRHPLRLLTIVALLLVMGIVD